VQFRECMGGGSVVHYKQHVELGPHGCVCEPQVPWKEVDSDPVGFLVAPEVGDKRQQLTMAC
jgi:hypothetical protein